MTTFNSERFLREQLESFATQERLPDELVVSDDASGDRSVEIVREFAARAPFSVHLLRNERNFGIAKNIERAISKTSGETIFLSDSDDWWYPKKILLMLKALRETPSAGIAICNADVVNERLEPLGVTSWAAYNRFSPSPAVLKRIAKGEVYYRRMPSSACCMAFRAGLKPLILPLPGGEKSLRRAQDHFIACTVICSGAGGAALLPEPLLAYRRHFAQVTHEEPAPFFKRAIAHLAAGRERPYLLPFLIDRLESDVANRLCVNAGLRSSALRHWRARRDMSPLILVRLPIVARELLTRRYRMFSGGAVTAAKDLLFAGGFLAPVARQGPIGV